MLTFYVLVSALTLALQENIGIVLIGRHDVPPLMYSALSSHIQQLSNVPVLIASESDIDAQITQWNDQGIKEIFLLGHSMNSGGRFAQDYVLKHADKVSGLILLSAFLQRIHRAELAECNQRYERISFERSLRYPLGYLQDGAHECTGNNSVEFPVPTLTMSGELDGVIRISRIAEAWNTQPDGSHPVVVIEGMNHGQILASIPSALPDSISSRDIRAEAETSVVFETISLLVKDFVSRTVNSSYSSSLLDKAIARTDKILKPIADVFVELEGNWFFTGGDEEHGSSSWAAFAHKEMLSPLPASIKSIHSTNEFHLLSDDDQIPPYYRNKHRSSLKLNGDHLEISSISQLRFVEIGVYEAGIGLNAAKILEEEKASLISRLHDDGLDYVSSIQISSKLSSRQLVFNLTGLPAPPSLDDGNRCMQINNKAFQVAFERASSIARSRFINSGFQVRFLPDSTPSIPAGKSILSMTLTMYAGPWFLWDYIQYEFKHGLMTVQSPTSFFALDANAYGRGNHYCQLLSPARALEWIYTDALRNAQVS